METENRNPIGLRKRYLLAIDLTCVLLALFFSFLLRYETWNQVWPIVRSSWPLFLVIPSIRLPIYYRFHLYLRVWRYASTQEFKAILMAGAASSLGILILGFWLLPLLGVYQSPSYSILVLEGILGVAFLGGTRFLLRLFQERIAPNGAAQRGLFVQNRRRILIAGAEDAGAMILRETQNGHALGLRVIGFVDDAPSKLAMHIHGVPVLGRTEDIPALVKKHRIDEVIIAMPTASPTVIDNVYHYCSTAQVYTRELPSIYDLLNGTLTVEQLRQSRPLNSYGFKSVPAATEIPSLKNVMITGGAGFIGSNFVHYMLQTYPDYRIVVYDKLTYAGNMDNLLSLKETYGDRYAFIKGDICDYAQVVDTVQRYEIDTIVNFAAESHVDRSLMNPESFLHTNVYGTYTLLRAARHFGLLRYHQVSTDEVYGQVMRGSFGEEDPLETRSPYSASKAGADLLVHAYFVSFGVPATITRGSNNIGPYQYPEKVVPLFITNALENRQLPVYGDGLYVRDYQYVIDHCRGIDLVLHKGAAGEIYNLGSGNEMTALDLARQLLEKLEKPESLIRLVADRPGQDRRYSLDCSKIKALGWESQWSFDQALDDTIEWYLENEWWWQKLKNAEYWQYYERQYRERLNKSIEPDPQHNPVKNERLSQRPQIQKPQEGYGLAS